MTAPGQILLRDVLHQVAAGLVALALVLFLSWHFWPGGWAGLGRQVDGPLLLSAGAALLLLPAWLVLLYVLGAVVPNPYGVLARSDSLLHRGMLALGILERQDPPAPGLLRARGSATQAWRRERIASSFGIVLEDLTPGELEDLLRLMAARVMSREATLAQLDVERHFSLALFNARLAALFFLVLLASLAGLLGKLLVPVLPTLPAMAGAVPWPGLAALAGGSYLAAYTCGRRAQGIYRQWHCLVIDAFVARAEVGGAGEE